MDEGVEREAEEVHDEFDLHSSADESTVATTVASRTGCNGAATCTELCMCMS